MTKKELLRAIKDMPDEAEIMIRFDDSRDGRVHTYDIRVETHLNTRDWRDKGKIIIDEVYGN